MDTAVRCGIVGLGGMGTEHAGNVTEAGHDVVAGTDVVDEKRSSFAAEFDAATYEDHEAMYEAESLDAVVITTPNAFHAPAAIGALERNIAVLCEKPLADSLSAAEEIADAAHASDAFCMVGFHNRFSGAASLFESHRERGTFGDVSHVEVDYVRRRGIPGVGSWFTQRDLSGGGALIDLGVHAIDFALYLAGFPEVEEVSGVTRSQFGDRADYADPDGWAGHWDTGEASFDVDDSASAFVRCVDGTTISLEVAWATNRDPSNEVVIRGTEAGARCTVGGDSLTLYSCDTGGHDHYDDRELFGSLDPSGHAAQDRRFLEAVAEGAAPDRNTVEQGLAVQRVLDGIYRSSESGSAVAVEDDRRDAPVVQP